MQVQRIYRRTIIRQFTRVHARTNKFHVARTNRTSSVHSRSAVDGDGEKERRRKKEMRSVHDNNNRHDHDDRPECSFEHSRHSGSDSGGEVRRRALKRRDRSGVTGGGARPGRSRVNAINYRHTIIRVFLWRGGTPATQKLCFEL